MHKFYNFYITKTINKMQQKKLRIFNEKSLLNIIVEIYSRDIRYIVAF